jgi:signal transduction histidine kinase/AmiR/NasT family two-component response regulator
MDQAISINKGVTDATLHSLESLGIEHSVEGLSIEVEVDGSREHTRAFFNPETRRWKLSEASRLAVRGDGSSKKRHREELHSPRTSQSPREPGSPVWTRKLPQSEFLEVMKHVDWSSTPLGPLPSWGVSLQQYMHLLLSDSSAAAIYWGPQHISIHNDIMGQLVMDRLHHQTNFLGLPFNQAWPELVETWTPLFERIRKRGLAEDTINIELFPTREFGVEECFFTGTVLPLRDEHGQISGFYNRAAETTKETLRERRTKTLNLIAAPSDLLIGGIWDHVFHAFEENPRDFPLALAFSATDDVAAGRCMLQLRAAIGVPLTHPSFQVQDLYSGKGGFMSQMRKAKAENRTVLLHAADHTLSEEMLKEFGWRGFEEPSSVFAIIPIISSDRLISIAVIGLNPRRPYDDEYSNFLNHLTRQISATVTSATDHEESLARETRLATQLQNSEKQIRNLAEFAPIGMCRIATSGQIMWANDQFYEISGHEKTPEAHYELSFVDIVLEEDQATSAGLWPVLLEQRKKVSVALRMKRTWTPPLSPGIEAPTEEHAWVLAIAYPIVEEDEVTSIAGCITDISTFKWAEAVQARSATAAKEAKKLQEAFIDIVSHEMRNPLSAIIQCADGIEGTMDDDDNRTVESLLDSHKHNVEAAKVILLCAGHQKRIIDDVLTLSKLDSLLLSVTPVASQPIQIMDSIETMFEAEFASHDIRFSNIRESEWQDSKVDWVYLDPSRVTQIIINLISNAIKFTSGEQKREINLRLWATTTKPPPPDISWFPSDRARGIPDVTLGPEWGSGEQIYISFGVEDTGKGLDEQEKVKLFGKFQQASPRTHVKYGGSGLGLFISRELTELQGGEIGIRSKPGKGSMFAFYIKTRRAEPPEDADRLAPALSNKEQKRRSANLRKNSASSPSVTPVSRPDLCVLLVEDNIVNQNVLARQLRKNGCVVYVANHGAEALDLIKISTCWDGKNEPDAPTLDVVLMDVEMPVMDGLTCTRRIRKLELDGSIKEHLTIIAITANARKEQMDHALEAGVDSVQPKPFKVAELLARVHQLRSTDTTYKGRKNEQ